MSRHLSLVAGATGLVIALGLLAGSARAEGPEDLKGKPAPAFALKTTNDKSISLKELKGNVVVVDFWATWCPPCRASLPHIQKLSADKDMFKSGLRVLAINAREGKPEIEAFMTKNKFTFAVPMDSDGATMGAYAVQGIPTTVVIGRDGVVRAVFVGFNPGEGGKGVDDAVEKALAEK